MPSSEFTFKSASIEAIQIDTGTGTLTDLRTPEDPFRWNFNDGADDFPFDAPSVDPLTEDYIILNPAGESASAYPVLSTKANFESTFVIP